MQRWAGLVHGVGHLTIVGFHVAFDIGFEIIK